MFNIAVIRIKDLLKYLGAFIIIAFVIYGGNRYFFNNEKIELKNVNIISKIANIINDYVIYPIDLELPIAKNVNQRNNVSELIDENNDTADDEFITEMFKSALGTELAVMRPDIQISKEDNTNLELANDNEKSEEETTKEQKELEKAETDVKTEVVTKNPLVEKYTKKYKGVKIKNETDFELTDDVLNPDSLDIDKSNVIIFHTHTCESYTPSKEYSYKATGNFRTTDLKYNVSRVGDELNDYLKQYGFNTVHNRNYHDYPSYSGSYTRSLATVSGILKETPADIIIDLHRDAIGSNSSYAPTVKIGDEYCAQIMFVMGTNGGGLYHPNWQSNLKFAVKLQSVANELYPDLFKPMIVRNSRYNQHLGKAACIIEVGSTGNTLEQCLNSMKYFSEVMNKALK